MATVDSGTSDAALLIEQMRNQILDRRNSSVTLSRSDTIESVFEAWQPTDERWELNADEIAVPEDVKDALIRFIQKLPLGFPQPEVSSEPDGHINLEWYRLPRQVLSVSISPNGRLHWAR